MKVFLKMTNNLLLLSPIRSIAQLVEHPVFIGSDQGRFPADPMGIIIEGNNRSVAQLVEQLTLNQRAQGSNPCRPTEKERVTRR